MSSLAFWDGAGWGEAGGPLKATEGPVVFVYLFFPQKAPWQVATRAGDGQRAMEAHLLELMGRDWTPSQ